MMIPNFLYSNSYNFFTLLLLLLLLLLLFLLNIMGEGCVPKI